MKYWAEPEAREIVWPAGRYYSNGIVIPLFDEDTGFLESLPQPSPEAAPLLLVAVVNAPCGASADAIERTRGLLAALRDLSDCEDLGGRAELVRLNRHQHLLIVDRVSIGMLIQDDQGVGLARKIGCDILVSAHLHGHLISCWISNVDADVIDFSAHLQAPSDSAAAAVVLPFEHRAANETPLAMAHQFYELKLWHYVLGLAMAGSPYSFHTVGSTLVLRIESYVQVRGIPKRSAGEDFHLLNKLRKVGPVRASEGPAVPIRCRDSARTPFGTGPAVRDLIASGAYQTAAEFYDSRVFLVLQAVLSLFREEEMYKQLPIFRKQLEDSRVGEVVDSALQLWGAPAAHAAAMRHSASQPAFQRHWHTWFDGLKTLRLVHTLTQECHARVGLDCVLEAGTTLQCADSWRAMVVKAENRWRTCGYERLGAVPLGGD